MKYTSTGKKNRLGQDIYDYVESSNIEGWLDMLAGTEADRAQSLQTSSHVFITDQIDIDLNQSDRLKTDHVVYEVTYIDNPVNLNHHLEIYLKVAG
nr:head-tail adaptor protein [Streptococcus suis]